jgi:hypothetical protein
MKTLQCLVGKLVPCLILAATIGFTSRATADPQQQTAKVVSVQGSASYSTDNQNWQTLQPGATLQAGAVIKTGDQSKVDLQLDAGSSSGKSAGAPANTPAPEPSSASSAGLDAVYNGAIGGGLNGGGSGSYTASDSTPNMVRVEQNSEVCLQQLQKTQAGPETICDTSFDLRSGSIAGCSPHQSPASHCQVSCNHGQCTAHVQGTFYFVTASGDVSVVTGTALVTTTPKKGQSSTVSVPAGYTFDPLTGKTTQIDPKLEAKLLAIVKEFHLTSPSTSYTLDRGTITVFVTPVSGQHGHHKDHDHDQDGDHHGNGGGGDQGGGNGGHQGYGGGGGNQGNGGDGDHHDNGGNGGNGGGGDQGHGGNGGNQGYGGGNQGNGGYGGGQGQDGGGNQDHGGNGGNGGQQGNGGDNGHR